jgi:lysophospholipase L1-like esterase
VRARYVIVLLGINDIGHPPSIAPPSEAVTVRDPAHPSRMLAQYDSGDHLHPNDAGMRAMADAIPLRLFRAAQPVR